MYTLREYNTSQCRAIRLYIKSRKRQKPGTNKRVLEMDWVTHGLAKTYRSTWDKTHK